MSDVGDRANTEGRDMALPPKGGAEVALLLGMYQASKGNIDEAIAEYKKAIELDPNYALARYNLGLAYSQRGLLEEAMEQYRKALEINPKLQEAHLNLGNLYARKGMFQEALSEHQIAAQIKPDDVRARYNLALDYYNLREYRLALQEAKAALELGAPAQEFIAELEEALSRQSKSEDFSDSQETS